MARVRLYASNADRQDAYRRRQQAAPRVGRGGPRRPSRPQRLAVVETELRSLAAGYQHWCEALPENQADSELAEQLQTLADQLEAMADELQALDIPRGFGR